MLLPRLLCLLLVAAACGADKTSTSPTESQDTTADTTAGDASTSAAEGTTGEPIATSDPLTTTASPTSTGEPANTTTTSTTDTTEATGTSTGCGVDDCGVAIEEVSSKCDEQNPDMVPPLLAGKAAGPGMIAVSEAGFAASCCLMLEPDISIAGDRIEVTYKEIGEPCDCICYYAIEYLLTGVAAGTWTVASGAQSFDVEVE